MKEPRWLTQLLVLAIHSRLLAEHGGSRGVRDMGRLHSVLGAPERAFARKRSASGKASELGTRVATFDLFELAAVYAAEILQKEPFLEGNTMTAVAVAGVFLELNGVRLEASEADAVMAIQALAGGEMKKKGFAQWLRMSTQSRVNS